jgi:hypothetical protein
VSAASGSGQTGPATITATSSVNAGGTINVTIANGPGNTSDWLALFPSTAPDASTSYVNWMYMNGQRFEPAPGLTSASLQFPAPATAGTYNVRLFANGSWTKVGTSGNITVSSSQPSPPSQPASITATASVAVGGTIAVAITNGPGNPSDWLGLFPSTAPDASTSYVDWMYMNGLRAEPGSGLTSASLQLSAPTAPGVYNVRLFSNGTWTKIATSGSITVTSAGQSGPASIAATAAVSVGGTINVSVANGPANRSDWLALFPSAAPDTSTSYVAWMYLNGQHAEPASGLSNASLQVPAPATVGTYNIRLFANGSWTKVATSGTITVSAAAPPNISVTQSVTTGGTISVTITNGPGNITDWLALFPRGTPDASTSYVSWMYMNGQRTEPASGVNNATLQFVAPAPGSYDIRLFANGGWIKLATSAMITVLP